MVPFEWDWADHVERVEVSTDGRVLLARLYGRPDSERWHMVPAPGLPLGGGPIISALLAHE